MSSEIPEFVENLDQIRPSPESRWFGLEATGAVEKEITNMTELRRTRREGRVVFTLPS